VPLRIKRFLRYAAVGVSTLLFDLALLWIFVEWLSINYLFATGFAFFIAVSVNYAISRVWVFRGSERGIGGGYVYFVQIAIVGAVATTFGTWLVVSLTGWHFLIGRVIVANIIGIWNYLMNLFLNFRVAGKPLDR
jgi:putative flippase GtrA